jgi:hypothetical protein
MKAVGLRGYLQDAEIFKNHATAAAIANCAQVGMSCR